MKSIEAKILSTIKNKKVDGYAFSSIDFIGDFSRDSIDKALKLNCCKKCNSLKEAIMKEIEISDFFTL